MDFNNSYLLMGTVAIMFFSIAIQSMIGFGNALITTPLLLSIGSLLTFANQLGQKIGKQFNMQTLRVMIIVSLGIIGIYYVVQSYL